MPVITRLHLIANLKATMAEDELGNMLEIIALHGLNVMDWPG